MRNACQDLLCRLMNQSFDRWEYLVTLKYHIRYVCEKIKCFFGVLCSTAERKNCSLKAAVALGDFRIELSRLRARKVVTYRTNRTQVGSFADFLEAVGTNGRLRRGWRGGEPLHFTVPSKTEIDTLISIVLSSKLICLLKTN